MSLPLFFLFCFSFCFSRSASPLVFAGSLKEASGTDGGKQPDGRHARQLFTERPRPRRNGAPPPLIELWRSCRQVVRASPSLVPWHSLYSTQLSVRATPIPWLQPAGRDECSPRGSDRADLGVAVTHPAAQNNVEMARNLAEVGVWAGGMTASVNQVMHRCCVSFSTNLIRNWSGQWTGLVNQVTHLSDTLGCCGRYFYCNVTNWWFSND